MVKNISSILIGYAVWTLVFLGGSTAIRASNPVVHDDQGITSDTTTLAFYLVASFIASFLAGITTAKIANSSKTMHAGILAVCLLATGIPVQLSVWDVLPVWYNLVFLILLAPITMAGASLIKKSTS